MAFLCPPVFGTNRKKRDRPTSFQLDEKYLLPSNGPASSAAPPPSELCGFFSSTLSLDDDLDVNIFLLIKRRFTARHPSELNVKRNDIVMFLHKDRGWLFVRQQDGLEGYVPKGCCRVYDPLEKKQQKSENWIAEVYHDRSSTQDNEDAGVDRASIGRKASDVQRLVAVDASSDAGEIVPYEQSTQYRHCPGCDHSSVNYGRQGNERNSKDDYAATNNNNVAKCVCRITHRASHSDSSSDDSYSTTPYVAIVTQDCYYENEGDVTVRRGERVSIIFEHDEKWLWVRSTRGEEGFIPVSAASTDITSADSQGMFHRKLTSESSDTAAASTSSGSNQSINLCGSTKFTIVHDYKATKYDELTLRQADVVHANLKEQLVAGHTWVYSPRLKTFGFIPTRMLHLPKITSL